MENELEKPAPASYSICMICFEIVHANSMFNNNGMCEHNFCSDCIAKYVEVKVVERSMANIGCPDLDCKLPLDPLSCRPILPKHLFDKWSELLSGETLLQKYDLGKRCYCPYPDCSALVLDECNDKPTKSTCPNCKKNFCFQCQSPWHAGYLCSEKHIERSPNDVLFGKLIEENKWARCRRCGHAVQRISGCRVISCRCGHRFCHACGETIHFSQPCKCFSIRTEFVMLVLLGYFALVMVLVAAFLCLKGI